MATVPIPNPRPTIRVTLAKNIELPQINAIIGSIVGRVGCRTCGLLGFDLQLEGDTGDPFGAASLPGAQSINFE